MGMRLKTEAGVSDGGQGKVKGLIYGMGGLISAVGSTEINGLDLRA